MKLKKYIRQIIPAAAAVLLLFLSSCGRASFDVTINVDDTSIPLSGLSSTLKVQGEYGVESSNMGTDISEIIYTYTATNTSTVDMTLTVKLSLYGEVAVGELKTRVVASDGTGDPDWLQDPYEDVLKDYNGETAGWTFLIGSTTVPAGKSVTVTKVITDNDVINHILKQDEIWVVGENVADETFSTLDSGSMELTNQSIEAVGSKDTGFFPGAFGEL